MIMKTFFKSLILGAISAMLCFSLSGCDKYPEGQGELIVKVKNAGTGNRVVVSPSDGGPSIAKSGTLQEGWNTVSFTLNAGNYIVSSGNSPAKEGVQVVENESVTITLHSNAN